MRNGAPFTSLTCNGCPHGPRCHGKDAKTTLDRCQPFPPLALVGRGTTPLDCQFSHNIYLAWTIPRALPYASSVLEGKIILPSSTFSLLLPLLPLLKHFPLPPLLQRPPRPCGGYQTRSQRVHSVFKHTYHRLELNPDVDGISSSPARPHAEHLPPPPALLPAAHDNPRTPLRRPYLSPFFLLAEAKDSSCRAPLIGCIPYNARYPLLMRGAPY